MVDAFPVDIEDSSSTTVDGHVKHGHIASEGWPVCPLPAAGRAAYLAGVSDQPPNARMDD